VVGRHRLGHPDRRVRWPDAGRSSVSDAAYRGIANGMSGKWISIERPPCGRAFSVSASGSPAEDSRDPPPAPRRARRPSVLEVADASTAPEVRLVERAEHEPLAPASRPQAKREQMPAGGRTFQRRRWIVGRQTLIWPLLTRASTPSHCASRAPEPVAVSMRLTPKATVAPPPRSWIVNAFRCSQDSSSTVKRPQTCSSESPIEAADGIRTLDLLHGSGT
jgi:hypothetical protein